MEILWISILGFSSGRTGWVLTDGSPPYDGDAPTSDRSGILDRFDREDVDRLTDLASQADEVRMLSYSKNTHCTVDHGTFMQATVAGKFGQGDDLVDLIPEDD